METRRLSAAQACNVCCDVGRYAGGRLLGAWKETKGAGAPILGISRTCAGSAAGLLQGRGQERTTSKGDKLDKAEASDRG